MGFYRDRVLPHLIHAAMRQEHLAAYRRRVAAAADGVVLEIGVGSGLNLPFYPSGVTRIVGIDPSAKLLAMAREAASSSRVPVDLVDGSVEVIPLGDGTVDTVVTTWTLCSMADVERGLSEVRRVLKPHGALLFVEHGLAPDARVRRWQDRLTPVWKRIGGGCHLNRAVPTLVEDAGFRIERIESGYADGPRPMAFMYEGRARPA